MRSLGGREGRRRRILPLYETPRENADDRGGGREGAGGVRVASTAIPLRGGAYTCSDPRSEGGDWKARKERKRQREREREREEHWKGNE